MANFKIFPKAERQQRRHAHAQKKQARKHLKRREKILAGLADPVIASGGARTFPA